MNRIIVLQIVQSNSSCHTLLLLWTGRRIKPAGRRCYKSASMLWKKKARALFHGLRPPVLPVNVSIIIRINLPSRTPTHERCALTQSSFDVVCIRMKKKNARFVQSRMKSSWKKCIAIELSVTLLCGVLMPRCTSRWRWWKKDKINNAKLNFSCSHLHHTMH